MAPSRLSRRTIVANASANLLRLIGSGIVALIFPSLLARTLSTEVYNTWAIVMQWALFVGLLEFGIQTAVARFVAHADEINDVRHRNGIVSTAFLILLAACAGGILLTLVLVWQLPHVFRTMPAGLQHQSRVALLLMGSSFALGLPISVIPAIFIGRQRNHIPAGLAVANKFIMAVLVIAVALRQWGIAAMGASVAIANLVLYAGTWATWRLWARDVGIRLSCASKAFARQIVSYSGALTVWIGAMLLISGLDLSLVGIFDYKKTAAYHIAATLTNIVAQTQGAIFAALLPVSAVLGARADSERLGTMLLSSTRYGCLILLMIAIPLLMAGRSILRVWVGADYAAQSYPILQVLIVANVIRLCSLPYSTLLLGTGQQRKVIVSPIAEAITNLLASVTAAYFLGAIGVAIGTLVGSFLSVGLHFFYNMPRTSLIAIDRTRLVKEGPLRPAVCAAPLGPVLMLRALVPNLSPILSAPFIALAMITSLLLLWNYALLRSERDKLQHVLRWA
jgi:O-antigen/teichoic acid export membrane protein